MDTQQSLAVESFSSSWLSHNKQTLDGLIESPRTSIGFHYEGHNFDFDAIAQTTGAVIHADELFTNGFIRSVYVDPSEREPCNNTLDTIQTTPITSPFSSTTRKERLHSSFLRRFRKSTRRMLRNLYGNLRGCLRKRSRVDDVDWRKWKVGNLSQASPQLSTTASSVGDESIYEAVLHCKRSIEQDDPGKRYQY